MTHGVFYIMRAPALPKTLLGFAKGLLKNDVIEILPKIDPPPHRFSFFSLFNVSIKELIIISGTPPAHDVIFEILDDEL